MSIVRRMLTVSLVLSLTACGGEEEAEQPTSTSTSTPGPGAASDVPPALNEGVEPTPTTELPGGSSVRTAAPEPATGCPANEVTQHLARPGTVHHRPVAADETLDLAGSPHRFPQGMSVSENATLTVEPCVLILVGDGNNITVARGGALVSEGAEGRPIRFDSGSADPAPGQWSGIHIDNNARPQTRFVHTLIEDAGASHQGAAIYVQGQFALKVQHVTIRHSGQHGVRLEGEAHFTDDSTALTVTESGKEDPYSAPVWFKSASQVRTLPEGEYSGNASDEIYVDRREVRTNATWRNPGVRYRLHQGLSVGSDNGAVLTISPGTTLAFNSGTYFAVGFGNDGGIVLDGESAETPITLTSARPHPSPGDWGGVRLGQHRADSVIKIDHAVIEHAGSEARHPHTARERNSCREHGRAAVAVQHHDLGPKITNTIFRSTHAEAAALLLVFRGDSTDYTAEVHGNDLSEAGTECRQNLQAEGDCPDPACR